MYSRSKTLSSLQAPVYQPRILQAFVRLLVAAINLYAVCLLVYIAARLVGGPLQPVVELGSNFMPPALLLGVALLLVSLALRRRLPVLLLAPAAIYFVAQYGALFLPASTEAASDGSQLRILTHNLHGKSTTLEPISDIIHQADADIVALQELTEPTWSYLTAQYADEYPHQIAFTSGMSIVGQGVLSRFPLSDAEYWELGLGNMRLLVTLDDRTVTLYNLHPPPPAVGRGFDASGRNAAVDEMLARLANESGALILAGDFNTTSESGDYVRLTQTVRLRDAFREAGTGLGPTFPNMAYTGSLLRYLPPLFRIDYIFFTEHFSAVSARVWHTSGGSDHYPVLATLALE